MKKKIGLRGLLGFPLGVFLGCVIAICISIAGATGDYTACVPELVERMGNEINAVILQTILSGLLGSTFAACSVIWEMENWSIAKQTGIYFLITSFVMMPIAYLTNWMEHNILGILSYFIIFILIFIIVWVVQYLVWGGRIKKINSKLQ